MPVLLYGCENWILTERTSHQLESFLGWMIKKALKWPQHLSNTAALVALGVESIKSRILIRKLGFLLRLMSSDADGIAASAMHALLDDPDSISIIRECRELETVYGLKYTDTILCGTDSVCLHQIKKEVLLADKTLLLDLCFSKAPLIAKVVRDGGSWPALWDSVRHLGSRHTIGLQNLTRMLAHHGRGSKPCPLCDQLLSGGSLTDHVLTLHKADINLPHLTTETLLAHLVERNVLFTYRFRNIFNPF